MFTFGRKHEFFEYAESISNQIHIHKPTDPNQNQEIQDGHPVYCRF